MVEIIPIEPGNSEYDELLNCRGPLAMEWIRAWNALSSLERDLCTHPVWISSFFNSINQLPAKSQNRLPVILFAVKRDGALITCIPIIHSRISNILPGMYYAKSPTMIAGSSLAVPTELAGEVAQALFDKSIWHGGPPLSIIFDKIDSTNMALHGNVPCITIPAQQRTILNLEQGFDQVYKNLRRKTRKELNRATRKLESLGTVSITDITETEDILNAFERYVQLEGAGWKNESQYAMKNNQFNRSFYRFLIEHMSKLNAAVVSELRFNGTLIASQIAIVIGMTLYSLKITYNEDFAEYSPGNLLIARVLAGYMEQHNLTVYNCVSDSRWFLKTWRADTHETFKCLLFPDSLRGHILRMLYRTYHGVMKSTR